VNARLYPTARFHADMLAPYGSDAGGAEERLAALPVARHEVYADPCPRTYTIFVAARDLDEDEVLRLLPEDQRHALAELRLALVDGALVDRSEVCPRCLGACGGEVWTADEGPLYLECTACEGEGRVDSRDRVAA